MKEGGGTKKTGNTKKKEEGRPSSWSGVSNG